MRKGEINIDSKTRQNILRRASYTFNEVEYGQI